MALRVPGRGRKTKGDEKHEGKKVNPDPLQHGWACLEHTQVGEGRLREMKKHEGKKANPDPLQHGPNPPQPWLGACPACACIRYSMVVPGLSIQLHTRGCLLARGAKARPPDREAGARACIRYSSWLGLA